MNPPDFCDIWSTARQALAHRRQHPLLCVVEGRHDVEFLLRLSATLARSDPTIPDLGQLERTGHLIFVPFGGGDVLAWSERFAPLGCPEFHLYDREILPETLVREAAVARVNKRAKCRAFLTTKRGLENYLHPLALVRAGGSSLMFDDNDSVANCVARQSFQSLTAANDWNQLSRRTRARFANRAKRWLNTVAVEQLTSELLTARDPHGELVGWLRTIITLLEHSRRTTAV